MKKKKKVRPCFVIYACMAGLRATTCRVLEDHFWELVVVPSSVTSESF